MDLRWKYKLPGIRSLLTEDESDTYINKIKVVIADRIEALIKGIREKNMERDFTLIADTFRHFPESGGNLEAFNYEMSELYDLCDHWRVLVE